MSVINQMLRDLEDRESPPQPKRAELAAIEGVAAPEPEPAGSDRRTWVAAVVGVVGLIIAGGAAWYGFELRVAPEPTVVAEAAVTESVPPAEMAESSMPEPIPIAEPMEDPIEAGPEPIRLVGFRHANGGDESTVALSISGDAGVAPVMEIGPEQGQILLPGVAIDGVDVGSLEDPRIRRFAVQDEGEVLRVSYEAAPGIRVKVATDRSNGSGPVMTLAFAGKVQTPKAMAPKPLPAPKPIAEQPEPRPQQSVTKRPTPTTAAERADRLYRQAAVDLRSGRPYSAEAKLRGALREQPGHVEAARVLGSLLAADGRTDEADALLGRALRLNPESSMLARAYARVQLRTGAAEQAVTVLESVLRRGESDADYLALLATAYQRTGRYERSVAMFGSALRLRPDTAKWWAGLGISLEADRRSDEALTAFQRSVELGGLDAGLARYVQSRLNALTPEG